MPDRSLDSLSTEFRPIACEWIAKCVERKVACMIVQTSRTPAEHQINLASGASGTTFSLHLPRSLRLPTLVGFSQIHPERDLAKADAMDLAPYEQYLRFGPEKLNWDGTSWEFGVIAEEAERLGLRSGVRWKQPFDPGHGELLLPIKAGLLAVERTRPWPVFHA